MGALEVLESKTINHTSMFKKLILKLFNIYPNIISFKEVFDLIGFPIITFTQGGRKFHFLFDTGTNHNIIDSNVLKYLEYEKVKQEGQVTLSGMDGIKHDVELCNITLYYKDQAYPFIYLSKDLKETFALFKKDFGIQLSGMIGTEFFAQYQYVIDFKDFIAYSKA